MMSSEDGFSLLRKMLDERLPLWVVFVEGDGAEHFDSKVLRLTGDELVLSKYEVAGLALNLAGADFRFADPIESSNPGKAGEPFEWCLALSWPNGALCRLFVVRDTLTASSK